MLSTYHFVVVPRWEVEVSAASGYERVSEIEDVIPWPELSHYPIDSKEPSDDDRRQKGHHEEGCLQCRREKVCILILSFNSFSTSFILCTCFYMSL